MTYTKKKTRHGKAARGLALLERANRQNVCVKGKRESRSRDFEGRSRKFESLDHFRCTSRILPKLEQKADQEIIEIDNCDLYHSTALNHHG